MATLKENMEAIKLEKDTKILPENLKSGITAFGVEGTMQAGVDTSDATATANDVRLGKTAYVNGEEIEGTLNRVTYVSNISNDGIVNTANIDVVDFGGTQYFTMTSNNPYMSNEETDESIVLTEGYIGPGGDNVNQVTLGRDVSEVADVIGLTSDKIVSGNTILGVEGTAEAGEVIDVPEFTPDTEDVSTEYVEASLSSTNDDTQMIGVKGDVLKDFLVREGSFIRGEIPYASAATMLGVTADVLTKGTTILGIEGTAETGVDTSDATATIEDIASGKTAYVNGEKITGTLEQTTGSNASILYTTVGDEEMSIQMLTARFIANSNYGSYIPKASTLDLWLDETTLANVIGLTADKIKSGETILGITGTYTGETIE